MVDESKTKSLSTLQDLLDLSEEDFWKALPDVMKTLMVIKAIMVKTESVAYTGEEIFHMDYNPDDTDRILNIKHGDSETPINLDEMFTTCPLCLHEK